MSDLINEIRNIGIVPVAVIDQPVLAPFYANPLIKGGIPLIEISFASKNTKRAIANTKREFPDILIGAGSVQTTKQVDDAIKNGARYVVPSISNEDVILYCMQKNIPVFPVCTTARELKRAVFLRISAVKFHPAESRRSLSALKKCSAAFPELKFIAAGNIGEDNVADYLDSHNVIAVSGSWMFPDKKIHKGDFSGPIFLSCKRSMAAMHGFTFAHIGINQTSQEEAEETVSLFHEFLSPIAIVRETADSYFIDEDYKAMLNSAHTERFEILFHKGRGTHGHIAFRVNDVDRAVCWLKHQGFETDPDGVFTGEKGTLAVYLKNEIAGFAIHLLRK